MKRSGAITLVLVGTATALLGYTATHHDDDADSWGSSTQPSSHYSGSGYHGSHYYGGGWRSSSGSHSGTSRGGFGGSGHAAGS